MNAPQIVWIVLVAINLVSEAEKHGKPKTGKHNFLISVTGAALAVGILYWGGFWS